MDPNAESKIFQSLEVILGMALSRRCGKQNYPLLELKWERGEEGWIDGGA